MRLLRLSVSTIVLPIQRFRLRDLRGVKRFFFFHSFDQGCEASPTWHPRNPYRFAFDLISSNQWNMRLDMSIMRTAACDNMDVYSKIVVDDRSSIPPILWGPISALRGLACDRRHGLASWFVSFKLWNEESLSLLRLQPILFSRLPIRRHNLEELLESFCRWRNLARPSSNSLSI